MVPTGECWDKSATTDDTMKLGRFVNSTTNSEQVDADVGFVKVWNSELTLAQIQAEHATYKTRFGY